MLYEVITLLLPRDRGVLDYLETTERELLERLDVQLAAPAGRHRRGHRTAGDPAQQQRNNFV